MRESAIKLAEGLARVGGFNGKLVDKKRPKGKQRVNMISIEGFNRIKEKHGEYASWAVWTPAGDKAKSNIGDLSVLDPEQNADLVATLRPNIVMLGLNISRPVTTPLGNFHDSRSGGQDYKIRFAFEGTRFYGRT